MRMGELSKTQKCVGWIINFSLLLLVVAAWLAQRYPGYSAAILATTVTFAAIVSAGSLMASRSAWQPDRSGELENSELSDATTGMAEETPEVIGPGMGAGATNAALIQKVIERYLDASRSAAFLRHSKPFVFPMVHFGIADVFKHREAQSFVDVAPKDPENYTVRVGLVTIKVRAGHTEIEIGEKGDPQVPARRGSSDTDKIDVVLRPDLGP